MESQEEAQTILISLEVRGGSKSGKTSEEITEEVRKMGPQEGTRSRVSGRSAASVATGLIGLIILVVLLATPGGQLQKNERAILLSHHLQKNPGQVQESWTGPRSESERALPLHVEASHITDSEAQQSARENKADEQVLTARRQAGQAAAADRLTGEQVHT